MKFSLSNIQDLIEGALKEQPTGDSWLDARYDEQVSIVGHTNPYYRLFYRIAQEFKPDLVVELGAWRGDASAHFALGNPKGEILTIDIHKDNDVAGLAKLNEAVAHLPNLTFINAWTWDAIDIVKALDKKIDVLFIDSWHTYDYAKQDWDLYTPLLDDHALIICDDITDNGGIFEGMVRFWDEIKEEKFIDTRVHRGIPMGFVLWDKKPKSKKGK